MAGPGRWMGGLSVWFGDGQVLLRLQGDGGNWLGGRVGAEAAVEGDVAEGEDAAVLGDHHVAGLAGDHAGDRLVEWGGTHGAVERDVEGEDAAIGGDEPVAGSVGGGGHGHDRLVELHAAGGSVKGGVAEAEDAAVAGDHPVAVPGGCGHRTEDGPVEPGTAHI